MPRVLDVHTLEDGAQPPEAIAERLVDWLGAASRSLDLALYDVRLPGPVGDAVADALRAAMRRGVRVRLAFNDDSPAPTRGRSSRRRRAPSATCWRSSAPS